MRQQRPIKTTVKRSGALVREVERNSAVRTKEVVNSKATHAKPDFRPTDLMEAVVERSNMIKALARVKRNKGAPGVDGLRVEDLDDDLTTRWAHIKQRLLAGEYQPSPVRRVEIPKPDGGVRLLGIPTVLDRLIQQAIGQVLGGIFEPTFSENSYGFRPGRSALQAVAQAKAYVKAGRKYVVDIDLEKFFDRVNHDILMERLARRIKDKRLLKTIRAYLESGVMIGGLEEPTREGTPQGGPLSPLLSNVLLDELDKELERRGHAFCRYADDCNIYVHSRAAGERVKASITKWLERRLKLKVNDAKSAVDYPSRRKFLGYSMTVEAKLKPAAKSVERFKCKIRELFRQARGHNVERFIEQSLNPLLRGWSEYFKLSEVKQVFEQLDGWIRRKLRCLHWRQWKRGKTRYRRLVERGLSNEHARQSSSNGHGPWWNSGKAHMVIAFPGKYFDQLGLIKLQTRVQRKAIAG